MKYTETYDSTSATSATKPTLKIQKESIPSNLTLTEGTTLVVYVALSSSSAIASQFTIQIEGSAGEVASSYFNTTQNTLTIPAGETAGHITILSLDDSVYHADSTWSLKLISHTTDIDSTDSLSFTLKDNDSNSAVAPTAVLAGLPSDPSNLLSFNVSVSGAVGSGVVSGGALATYQYKLGPSLSTICSVSAGYSNADIASSTSIIENLGVYADGAMTLCVIGKDASGNFQPFANATTYTWVKDTTGPTITSVTSGKANGAYTTGTVIDIDIAFSEAVTLTAGGTPTLDLNSNASAKANYLSGSGTSTLTFRYTVGAAHASVDLNYPLTTSLSLVGSAIQDSVGNSATLTLPTVGGGSSLGTLKNLYIDTTNPNVAPSSIDDKTWFNSTTQTPTISFTAGSDAESGIARHEIKVQDVTAGFVDVTTFATFTNNSSVSGLTLTHTKTYRVVLRAVDNAGNYSSETVSDGWTVDATAPIAPTSLDDKVIGFSSTDTPTLSWSAGSDALSGVQGYQIAIGDSSGGNNILDWTTVGNILTTTMSSLSLQGSKRYYTSVRTLDTAGGTSTTQASDGWWNLAQSKVAVDSTSPTARMASSSAMYGYGVAISEDGLTMVVGAVNDDTDASGGDYLSNAGAAFVYIKSGGSWVLQQKLLGTGTNGRVASDQFGGRVGISGDTVIVGAPGQDYDDTGANLIGGAGAAYVFTRTAGVWSQQQKLVGTGTNSRMTIDKFGIGVAISGDTVIVGADGQDYDDTGANLIGGAGAAYVFTRTAGMWSQQQKLVGTGTNGRLASDAFGGSVGISGDTVIVGARYQGYDAAGSNYVWMTGAAYVFTRSGSTWSQQQKIIATGVNGRFDSDAFGTSVAISGDTAIVGAIYQSFDAAGANLVFQTGAAYVFTRVAGVWSQQQKLVGTGTNGRTASDAFGVSVAISGDTAVIGAYGQGYDASGANLLVSAGAAYVFTRSGSTWSQQQKLVGTGTNGRVASDWFGSVAISGDTAIVGANGQGYDAAGVNPVGGAGAVFAYSRVTTIWSQDQKIVDTIVPQSRTDLVSANFGKAIAISDDGLTMIVGALNDDTDASGGNYLSDAGAAYVYIKSGGNWVLQQKLVGTGTNGRVSMDYFGGSVAISGNTVVIGASNQDYDASGANLLDSAGAAYVFTRSGTTWTQEQKLVGTGTNARTASNGFGGNVAISGDTAVIGANGQGYDANGANLLAVAGAAYVFTRSGTTWSQQQKLVGTGTNGRVSSDSFGGSVAISGDTAVIGANGQVYDASGANLLDFAGAAYVFTRSGTTWTQEQKLVGTGTNGRVAWDNFGWSVAISGDTAVIGAYRQDYDASGANLQADAGAAYVFTRSGTTWTQEQKLVGTGTNGRVASDNFGVRVAISGDTAVIGAIGQAYDVSGTNLLTSAGAAYLFTRSGTTWTQEQKLVGTGTNGRVASDWFGWSVAVSENGASDGYTIGVGASRQSYTSVGGSPVSSGAGAVFVFY
jgi:hypothetical protein